MYFVGAGEDGDRLLLQYRSVRRGFHYYAQGLVSNYTVVVMTTKSCMKNVNFVPGTYSCFRKVIVLYNTVREFRKNVSLKNCELLSKNFWT
jgi:hypothetical protein